MLAVCVAQLVKRSINREGVVAKFNREEFYKCVADIQGFEISHRVVLDLLPARRNKADHMIALVNKAVSFEKSFKQESAAAFLAMAVLERIELNSMMFGR